MHLELGTQFATSCQQSWLETWIVSVQPRVKACLGNMAAASVLLLLEASAGTWVSPPVARSVQTGFPNHVCVTALAVSPFLPALCSQRAQGTLLCILLLLRVH